MQTLSLKYLIEELTQLKNKLGDNFSSDVAEIDIQPRYVGFELESVEKKDEHFRCQEKEIEYLSSEINDLNAELKGKEAEIDKLNDILSEKGEGKSIREWIEEAEMAKESCKLANKNANEWSREVTALRKRKGIPAGYIKHQNSILSFIRKNSDLPGGKEILEALNS